MIDEETLPAMPTENALVGQDKQKSELPEAEKKIAALLHQYPHKNASLKLELSGLLLHSVPEAIQKLFSTLVKLDLSNNYLEVGLFQEYSLSVVQEAICIYVQRMTET
jgi:hypothetical protein